MNHNHIQSRIKIKIHEISIFFVSVNCSFFMVLSIQSYPFPPFNPLLKQRNPSPKKKKRIFLILYLPTPIYNDSSVKNFKILKNLYFQRYIFSSFFFFLFFFSQEQIFDYSFFLFFFFTHDRAKSARDDNARATTPEGGNFIIQPSRPKLFRGPWINYVARNHVGARATLRKHLLSA